VAARVVSTAGDITLISKEGMMIRTPLKTISQMGRSTRGVSVMKLKRNDVVASVAVLAPRSQADLDDLDASIQDDQQPLPPLTIDEITSDLPTNGQGS
jgi:DNA gyrase subunit A